MAFDALAALERTALVARQAAACRAVIVAEALGVDRARVGQGARVDAFVVVAGLVVRTFVVGLALQFVTAELRVS